MTQFSGTDRRKDPRRAPRARTRIKVQVDLYGRMVSGRIFDISSTGVAIDIEGPFYVDKGTMIKIHTQEFGLTYAIVKWNRNNRVGAEFDKSSNTAAQVASYFRAKQAAAKTAAVTA